MQKLDYLENRMELFYEINLYLRWHTLRTYCFVAEVTFKKKLYGPFYGWGSTASKLQNHSEEAVYQGPT